MEITNINVKNEELLGRKEVTFDLHFAGTATPKKEDVKAELAKKYNTKPENVAVRKMEASFGEHSAHVVSIIYEDEKVLKELEVPKGKKGAAAPKA
jgi:ribosomal protein S24E